MDELRRPHFRDTIAETEISIDYDPNTHEIKAVEVVTGQNLILQSRWWFTWKEFHPFSEIWHAEDAQE